MLSSLSSPCDCETPFWRGDERSPANGERARRWSRRDRAQKHLSRIIFHLHAIFRDLHPFRQRPDFGTVGTG